MTKSEFDALIASLGIVFKEGDVPDSSKFPYVSYWEYTWDWQQASGGVYNDIVTYQVSFFSNKPRDPKLIELLLKLREKGIMPVVAIEKIESPKSVHSYFALDVIDKVI